MDVTLTNSATKNSTDQPMHNYSATISSVTLYVLNQIFHLFKKEF